MRNNILSLKNIYNLLVMKDYPVEGGSVISGDRKKGMTLTKFWKENLLPQLTEGRYGTNIWKYTGTRNRHTSEICNRSSQLLTYEEYMQEIVALLNVEFLLQQTEQFMFYLRKHEFNYEVFTDKLPVFLDAVSKEDEVWNYDIGAFFEGNRKDIAEMESYGKAGKEFTAGYFLTFLTLHALTGEYMQSKTMHIVRENPQYAMKELWQRFYHREEERNVVFLTAKDTEIYGEMLPAENFWGREREQFDLREMLAKGGHYLLSGMGGIGKTELAKQFIRYCVKNKKVDYIGVIPYENQFAESLLRAFSGRQEKTFRESFKEVIGELKQLASQKKVLLFIDDVTKNVQEDEYLAVLENVPATIFMTSRLADIDGFETYPVKELSKDACELIFRDSYKRLMKPEDLQELNILLDDNICRHTLTIRWLGQAAYAMNWSVEELLKKLEKKEESILWKEKKRHVSLKDMYLQLYTKTGLHMKEKAFLEIMAALPSRKYPVSFLYTYLGIFMEENKQDFLHRLCNRGWLESKDESVFMHPVIAESISRKVLPEETLKTLFKNIGKIWRSWFGNVTESDKWNAVCECPNSEFIKSAELVADLFFSLPQSSMGRFKEYFPVIILASGVVKNHFSISTDRAKILKEMVENAGSLPDDIRIHAYLVCTDYMITDIALLKEEIRRQDEKPTISRELMGQLYNLTLVNMVSAGQIKDAENLLNRITPVTARDKVYYCMNRGLISAMKMDIEESYKWNRAGIDAAGENEELFSGELFQLRGSQTVLCHGTKRMEEAEHSLKQMKKYLREENVQDNWYYNFEKGTLLIQKNQVEEGIGYLKTAIEYAGYYFGREHLNYIMECEELALGQGKLRLFEEAEANHKIALEFTTVHKEYVMERCRILNNMGHMYIEWKKPDKAYECLKESYETCTDNDDLTMAEPAYNLARFYRLKNDTEKEMFYLQKACPVFERIYSDRSEKTIKVRKRLSELSGR